MPNVIYRGSTPTLVFKPTNGMNVSDLGTPTVAVVQDLVFLTPTVEVDASNNRILAKLTEAETLRLVAGVETRVQQAWLLENGDNVRFPIKRIEVADTLIHTLESEET